MTKKKSKKLGLTARYEILELAINRAFKDLKSAAQMKRLAEYLFAAASTMLAASRGKRDVEPYIMWSDDPAGRLFHAISLYATATDTPMDAIVEDMIMRIGPNVQNEYRWN